MPGHHAPPGVAIPKLYNKSIVIHLSSNVQAHQSHSCHVFISPDPLPTPEAVIEGLAEYKTIQYNNDGAASKPACVLDQIITVHGCSADR